MVQRSGFEHAGDSEAGCSMKRPSKELEALRAENWNLKHPIGTPVKLKRDSGAEQITKTRSQAYVCDAGYAVAFFEDVSGYYLLDRAVAL